jgi:cyclic-di-GMP-binding protein
VTTPVAPDGDIVLGFADARGCREWLNALPLTNIPQAQATVLGMVRALNAAEAFSGLEHLKCMELVRDKVAFLQGEQRSRYFGKSLPLSPTDSKAWSTGAMLLEEMERGYRRCLADAASDGELAAHRALIDQRIVRYIGTYMLFHAIVYRRFDPATWLRLHEQYASAEAAGHALERIKDSLEGDEEGASSVAGAYAQVVLVQAAYLSEMTAAQIDFAEALLKQWLRKLRIVRAAEAPESDLLPLVVDVASSIGARPVRRAELGEAHRVFDVDSLSKSLRKRIHGLQAEEDPASLGLPQAAGLDLPAQLKRLHKLWCEGAAPRPPAKSSEVKTAGLVFTPAEIHFFLSGGKIFEQPDRSREMTREEKQDMEVFGRVTERTQSKMVAEHNFSVEPWSVVEEMPGTWRVQRPSTASKGVAIGRLAAVRLGDSGGFYLGVIRALSHETDNRIIATIALFPGKPEPIAVRAGARNRTNAQWMQGFRLPPLERLQIPDSLIVPAAMVARGRGVETWREGVHESTVREILEHGADFDRITVA